MSLIKLLFETVIKPNPLDEEIQRYLNKVKETRDHNPEEARNYLLQAHKLYHKRTEKLGPSYALRKQLNEISSLRSI